MGEVGDLNFENGTYYYFDNIIDIRKLESNLLKIDKKSHRYFDIFDFGYIMIKKFSKCNSDCDYENIRSVNPLDLTFSCATGYFKKEYGEKYFILDSIERYEEVFSENKSEIETINSGEKLFDEIYYAKIAVSKDDDIPLDKH